MAVAVALIKQSESGGLEIELDRVDVYSCDEGYTATVIYADQLRSQMDGGGVEACANPIRTVKGSDKRWRDLDNLVAYVLRNVTNKPSIVVHFGK